MTPTRCKLCGNVDVSTVCRFCSVWKGVHVGDACVFLACCLAVVVLG